MEPDPYQAPSECVEAARRTRREVLSRPLVQIVIGVLSAFFVAPALYVALIIGTQLHSLAELLVIPEMIAGGIAAGCAAFAFNPLIRTTAWGCAGLGAGL